MTALLYLIRRNTKLYFKDKGLFFSSLITPLILLVLYATFLANVYRDSFVSALPEGMQVADSLIDATVGGQLISSLLAVSCVTVAFCCNMVLVQDKVNGSRRDLTVSPVSRSTLAAGYYASAMISTLLVNCIALAASLLYLANTGWYLTAFDVLKMLLDVLLLTLLGTALSSVINVFLSTQGQMSAVGTIVSAGYGFICGAYMPISNFSSGLQKALSYLPSTYATSLIKNHMLHGVFKEMERKHFPDEMVEAIRDTLDCNPVFHGNVVSVNQMIGIMMGSIAVFGIIYYFVTLLPEGEGGR